MKVGILTFQFAHNYGAMLQACALKRYLTSMGNEVDVVPFFPAHLKKEYSVSPFEKGISVKRRIYNALTYWERYRQANKFENFKKKLIKDVEFTAPEKVLEYLSSYDMLVCGSDQIWNDKITGDTAIYYGAEINKIKISYAASLGSKSLSVNQLRYAKRYLPDFFQVSVREESTKELLKEFRNDIQVVCDPVFLLTAEEWRRIEKKVEIKDSYMLLYLLEENEYLVEAAKNYAAQHYLKIIEVHPTLGSRHSGIELLKDVGPAEFLYLIRNAKAVCSNSFHAVSFSIIFGQQLLHIPNSKSPERTQNILNKAGIEIGSNPLYDLKAGSSSLQNHIRDSKNFISRAIEMSR